MVLNSCSMLLDSTRIRSPYPVHTLIMSFCLSSSPQLSINSDSSGLIMNRLNFRSRRRYWRCIRRRLRDTLRLGVFFWNFCCSIRFNFWNKTRTTPGICGSGMIVGLGTFEGTGLSSKFKLFINRST